MLYRSGAAIIGKLIRDQLAIPVIVKALLAKLCSRGVENTNFAYFIFVIRILGDVVIGFICAGCKLGRSVVSYSLWNMIQYMCFYLKVLHLIVPFAICKKSAAEATL